MVGRVYVGAHNPLDVICGAGLGVAIGSALNLVVDVPRRSVVPPPPPPTPPKRKAYGASPAAQSELCSRAPPVGAGRRSVDGPGTTGGVEESGLASTEHGQAPSFERSLVAATCSSCGSRARRSKLRRPPPVLR